MHRMLEALSGNYRDGCTPQPDGVAPAENEQRLRTLVEGFAQAVWETDAQGQVVADSPSWRAYTGQTLDEWLGSGWVDAFHPDDREDAWRTWADAVRSGRSVNAEFRLRTAAGGWRWTNVRAAPLCNPDGTVRKWVGMNIDVDDRHRAEEALRESEASLAAELAAMRRLHELSTRPVAPADFDQLYRAVIDAAVELTHADAGSVQILKGQELELLATRDIPASMVRHFARVRADSGTSCGQALALRRRSFVDFDAPGVPDPDGSSALHLKAGLRSAQSTPLVTRDGRLIGMLSTHWRTHYRPAPRELRLLDLLARQATDLIERAQAEAALRQSEEKYRTLFEHIDEGYALCELLYDDKGRPADVRFIDVNPAFTPLSGLSNVVGKRVLEVLPSVEPYWLAYSAEAVESGAPVRHQGYAAAIGRWLDIHFTPVGGRGSRQFAAVFQDISERMRVECALRDSEATQGFLLKLADALRPLGEPSQVQALACRMLGEFIHADRVVWADVEGDEYVIRYSHGEGVLPIDGRGPVSRFGAALVPAYRRGELVAVDDVAADPRFTDAERAPLLADGIAAFIGNMLVKDGRWVGAFVVHSKIPRTWSKAELALAREVGDRIWTAARRARAESALRESEARFRALADASPALIWQLDVAGNAVYLNQRYVDVTGMTRDQLREHGWHAMVHPDDLPAYLAAAGEALRRREPFQKRVRGRVSDGSWHWFETHAVPWFSVAGAYRGHVGISIDVTEAVNAEQSLRDADRRKDEFLATLAHELRNPLAPISNAVHLLRHPEGRRRADRIVEMVGRQVRQIVRLVDDLMEVSRITRGKIELDKAPVALGDIVGAALETSQPAIEQAQHHLELELAPEPLMVDGDKVRLTQVFTNLLNNAAKYTDRGGRIQVQARREGPWAVVSVRDNGVGIAPEQLPHVFEMFVQVHRVSNRGQGGLGIGLTMVRNLVEMHGGHVEASSAGPGQGSEFVVRLPLLATAGGERRAPRSAAVRNPLAGRQVLIVDDNRDAADSLCMLLSNQGARAKAVYDGRAGLAALEAERPDALVLDLGMPGMDGHEVARRIRLDPRFAGLCIIALTGWGQQADRQQSRSSGFDHHLTKPVDLGQLQALLAGCEAGYSASE